MNRRTTRDELIQVGKTIIAQQGFNTTGLNAVLSTAGVPKGSFYYYFPSKEEFGLAVIDALAADYAQQLDSFLADDTASPLQRLRRYLEHGAATMSECACRHGCPIGTLSQELAAQNELFRVRLDSVFCAWKAKFARCLAAAKAAGELPADSDSDQLAEFLLAGWQGALLRAKATQSPAPLQTFIQVLFERVLTIP